MEYKVCILAAGRGSRMEPFTNKINKSLLPVDFKATISHIIEKFDQNIEIVIAVGHLKETVLEYLECAHGDREFTIIEVDKFKGVGSGPGYSLLQCKEYLKSPFIFFASDTIVKEEIPLPSVNWLGVAEVTETQEYCTTKILKNNIISLEEKAITQNTSAFIGLAGVKDYEIFFEGLQSNPELKNDELQVSNGFSALISYDLKPHYFTWYDTGNLDGYLDANRNFSISDFSFDFSKSNEFLYFVGGNVIKYFENKSIIQNRYLRSKILKNLCPEIVCKKESFYSYKKESGSVLYDSINDRVMSKLISWLDSRLWIDKELSESENISFQSACFDFYYNKTVSRISEYHQKYQINDKSSLINGIKVPKLNDMFGLINWDELKKGEASNFHGDLQFDNIILKDNGEFLLIDWRQDFSGNLEYGDKYYDLAKLNGGIIVSYRVIKQGKFSFSEDMKGNVEISNEKPKELTISQKIFHKYIKEKKFDKTKIDLLTSLIYLNMSPMHNKPFDHFIYNFGKLSLYKTLLASGKILP